MKLLALNVWGGRLLDPLLSFVKKYSKDIDIFCFQEIYSSSEERTLTRKMHSQVLEELSKVLKEYRVYYSPQLKNRDIDRNTDFPLSSGLATFIRKQITVKEKGEFYVYRSGFELANDNYETIPKNLQYFVISIKNTNYLICNFHGIWYPKDKLDTEDRLEQSRKIKQFIKNRKEKIILCGDYNLQPSTKSLAILEENMRNMIKENNIISTRSAIYEGITRFADYILVSKDVDVVEFKVINTTVSDHLPLYVKFR